MGKKTKALAPGAERATDRTELAEVNDIARQMAHTYQGLIGVYLNDFKLSESEAIAKAREGIPQALVELYIGKPSSEATWWELRKIYEHDEQAGLAKWHQIKSDAAENLRTGVFALKAIELGGHTSPQERASFVAMRNAFVEDWRPSGAIELALIDTLAQAYYNYTTWLNSLTVRHLVGVAREQHEVSTKGTRPQVWVGEIEYEQHTAQMAERFNRLFLRTLRALRDLRRYGPSVHIASAGQVNIGAQQMNAAKIASTYHDDEHDEASE